MKFLVAWVFSVITLLGVLSPSRATTAQNLDSKQVYASTFSSSIQRQPYGQLRDLEDGDSHDSGCQHSDSRSHTCHLGHCAFTLGCSIYLSTTAPDEILDFKILSVVIFDFQTSPFRPPIA